MSEALLTQWRDRVLEVETEIGLVQDDITAALERRKALKLESRQHAEVIEREKRDLLKKLEAVEQEAKELSVLCERTLSEKDRVEAVYVSTLDEYESMHYLVHEIKAEEERLASREDLETRMQRESLAWAEEEHSLRGKLGVLQTQLKQSRKQQQQEVDDLEADLAALEKRLRQERQDRAGEVKQQARSAIRGSRQATPATARTTPSLALAESRLHQGPGHSVSGAGGSSSGTAGGVRTTTATTSSSPNYPASGSDKESSFLAANVNGSVPTRNTALRSCLKSGGAAVSAPVSRAGSQSLVTGAGLGEGAEVGSGGPQQPSLAMMRAYSYGPGKLPSRKRDMLGESTNQP